MPLLNDAVFSTVSDFLTVFSGDLSVDDVHDVPIVPDAAVISDFDHVPAVVGLPVSCCQLHYFCKHLCFRWRPYCAVSHVVALILAVVCVPAVVSVHDNDVILDCLLLALLLLLASLLFLASRLWQAFLLLHVSF